MSKTYLIGSDLGTSGTKTALFSSDGELIAEAFEESKLYYPQAGWVEQNMDEMYGSAIRTVKEVIEKSGVDASQIAGLSFDSQMAGISTIDKDWNAPTPYDSWLDTRCANYIPPLMENKDKVIELNGGAPSFTHGPKILWWMHERPEVYKDIAAFVMPGGYIAGKMANLSADEAFIDRTYTHFTCFADTAAGTWSDDLVSEYDVDPAKLPRIVDPWEVIGKVSKEVADATGLLEGTPIAAGCGDTAASMLGAGMTRPGTLFDVAGTASVFAICTDEFVADVENATLFTAVLPIPGLYYTLAYIQGGGLNLRWFRDELVPELKAKSKMSDQDIYELLGELAATAPMGAEQLIFLPHLNGRICPNVPNTRGVYFGLNWTHQRAHMYRAMLEAVAYEYSSYLSIVRDLFPDLKPRETHVIGGGAKSALWNQIKADVLGVPYHTLNREEAGVLGSAVLAGYATGVFEDMADTVERFIQPKETFTPDENAHAAYQDYVTLYTTLLEKLQPEFDMLASFESKA